MFVVATRLFALLVENVDSLIEGWFQNQIKSVHVLCPHCIKAHRHPPTTFSLKAIQLAVTQGRQHMPCHGALLDIRTHSRSLLLLLVWTLFCSPSRACVVQTSSLQTWRWST
jgi:hypothetical protein